MKTTIAVHKIRQLLMPGHAAESCWSDIRALGAGGMVSRSLSGRGNIVTNMCTRKWHNSEERIAIELDYKGDIMKYQAVLLLTGLMLISGGASAAGCVKGAAAGAVVGHVAGHHAVAGAVGGCLVGRHMAKEKAKKEKAEADAKKAQQNTQPIPAK